MKEQPTEILLETDKSFVKKITRESNAESYYYRILDELVQRKKKKEICGIKALMGMIFGILPLGTLFFVNSSGFANLVEIFSDPIILLGLLILIYSYGYYMIYYKKAEEKYDSLKSELQSRIWNDFFFYSEKEKFLKIAEEKYGINLYWK